MLICCVVIFEIIENDGDEEFEDVDEFVNFI